MTTPAQHLQHAAAMAAANTGMFGVSLPSSSSVPSAAATASTSAAHGNTSSGDGGGQSAPPAVPLSGPSTSTSHPVGGPPSTHSGAGPRRTPFKAQAPNKASAFNNKKDKGDKKTRSRLACGFQTGPWSSRLAYQGPCDDVQQQRALAQARDQTRAHPFTLAFSGLACKSTKQKCDGPSRARLAPPAKRIGARSEATFAASVGTDSSEQSTPSASSAPGTSRSQFIRREREIDPASPLLIANHTVPCRRCELYGLECKFPPSAGVVATTIASGSGVLDGSAPVAIKKFDEIAARLRNIEAALNITSTYTAEGYSPMNATDSRSPSRRSVSPASSDGLATADELDKEKANPIHEINDSIDMIVGKVQARAGDGGIADGGLDDYGAPDVVKRGTLTQHECQELFDFFFCSIHPWVMMLSLDEDRDAMGVRSRSSLLFHTILCLATSFSSPFPSALHTTLVSYVNAILAPQILNPQPHELTTDFLRAMDLLNLYKPTQFSTRRAEGKDVAESMRASKVNGLASWMLQGILARSAERLDLASSLSRFSRAYSASASGIAIPKRLLRDLRLYYWLLSNDVHGNVQSGRRCNMEGAAALTTTRLFSSLQLQPYDVRLAASVEMFEVARPILRSFSYERTRRIAQVDLDRYNTGMAAWEEFWLPMLQQQLAVDPLAMSVMCPFAWFITLQFNAAAYVSWKEKRFSSTDSTDGAFPDLKQEPGLMGGGGGGGGAGGPKAKRARIEPRGLTQCEHDGLERCVRAAEGLLFTLCEESRVVGAWRTVQWEGAERADGWSKLTLDQSIVEVSKWGMDAITCVAYIFPAVFLCKLVNEGILTPNLELSRNPSVQVPWRYSQKLPRLLELGASFLDSIALNPHHPARAQAHVLRTLLELGIKGVPPSPQPLRPTENGPPAVPESMAHYNLGAQSMPGADGRMAGAYATSPQQHGPRWPTSLDSSSADRSQRRYPPAAMPASGNQVLETYAALGPGRSAGSLASSPSGKQPGSINVDMALTNVLDGFDPMWTEPGSNTGTTPQPIMYPF
ncbi:BZ3501_MvSof-1269-A2-R1_Chr6-2g08684 [Microbotryum saponariae]|nr:BZ3501_MvSof-1269-A2-R1_Chr6-2g08684 [Microbotryum saponariae]